MRMRDSFFKTTPGFLKAFPNVDSLTVAMGNNAYYYQGRTIENIRINNTINSYAVNGSGKVWSWKIIRVS